VSSLQEERFKFDETLTGFKWLGHRALELQQAGFTPLFAFEEAIGFMFSPSPGSIKDKDGVAAAAVFAEMAADLKQWGIGVAQHLQSLRELYGYFETRSSYFTSDKPADIRAVFERLRQGGNYPKVHLSFLLILKPKQKDRQRKVCLNTHACNWCAHAKHLMQSTVSVKSAHTTARALVLVSAKFLHLQGKMFLVQCRWLAWQLTMSVHVLCSQ